jgi:ABC-type multidrug transport system fused ATPase/permease subunit
MGGDMLKTTLRKVLLAPVNTFFDVTPVGKILKIFQEEINIFRNHLFDPVKHIIGMLSHVVVVLSFMFAIGFWETLAGLCIMGTLFSYIMPCYLSADNQLHKVGSTLWGPIHSYFYECMRGTSVIRAFGQEKSIMKKQHELLDKTTTHFIAHHSSWCWYNLRMFYSSTIFHVLALLLIAKARTTHDTVSLVLLYNWTNDMGWLMHVCGCFNWFKRNMVEAQRVFNLQIVPQEKIEGPAGSPENWPSQGTVEFKDVKLRYRPNCDRALNGVSFKVAPGEKVGVVGRTGAGKSTLFMGLTRIVELEEGKIEIDGQDIAQVDLKALRD